MSPPGLPLYGATVPLPSDKIKPRFTTHVWPVVAAKHASNDTSTNVPSELKTKTTLFTPTEHTYIQQAASLLGQGNAIAIPTETVYGLAANALDPSALDKIFEAKGRPRDNPLIVHVSNREMLMDLIQERCLTDQVKAVMDAFWPGPLTILFEKSELVPDSVTCGHPTVAVRMPSHPVARAVIDACGFPLAAPSANTSGRPSPTLAQHVYHDLQGRIPCILDAGATQSGVESTVLDPAHKGVSNVTCPVILRPGSVTFEMLQPYLPNLLVYKKDFTSDTLESRPTTPGMKYRHYAPTAPVILFDPNVDGCPDGPQRRPNPTAITAYLETFYRERQQEHPSHSGPLHVGYLGTWSTVPPSPPAGLPILYRPFYLGSPSQPQLVAHHLFQGLRVMDASCKEGEDRQDQVDVILVEGVMDDKEGEAVMNRLRKAATCTVAWPMQ